MELRKIELVWRLAWMRILAGRLPGARTARLPDPKSRPLKVLFLRYEQIGDMIMATAVIRAIAQSAPGVSVDVVASGTNAPVLDNNPYVRKTFTLFRKSWRSYARLLRDVAAEKYDVVVDGRINTPEIFTSAPLVMLASGAPYRIGAGGGNNDLVYNVRVPQLDKDGTRHYIESSKALAEPFGAAEKAESRPQLFLTDAERETANAAWARSLGRVGTSDGPRLLVNLSASDYRRRWPDKKFIEVLRAARAAHPRMAMVIIALPFEWESVRSVAAAVDAEPVATPKLRDALALVGTSDLVFTPDTAISHAASAFDKPAVVLLKGGLRSVCDAPWETRGEIVLWNGETIHPLPVAAVLGPVLRLCSEFANQPPGAAKTS